MAVQPRPRRGQADQDLYRPHRAEKVAWVREGGHRGLERWVCHVRRQRHRQGHRARRQGVAAGLRPGRRALYRGHLGLRHQPCGQQGPRAGGPEERGDHEERDQHVRRVAARVALRHGPPGAPARPALQRRRRRGGAPADQRRGGRVRGGGARGQGAPRQAAGRREGGAVRHSARHGQRQPAAPRDWQRQQVGPLPPGAADDCAPAGGGAGRGHPAGRDARDGAHPGPAPQFQGQPRGELRVHAG
mmetsp:Transcript_59759/g.159753  ORF Transcript_59759/g.159753 Transcript_59759/m.159753 type:complete len:245 (-) Transcript_59759:1393-2127(-)